MYHFSIEPAGRGGLHQVLLPQSDEYDCRYLLFVATPLVLSIYGRLFLRNGSDDIRRIISLPISEFGVPACVQNLLYTAKGAMPVFFWVVTI